MKTELHEFNLPMSFEQFLTESCINDSEAQFILPSKKRMKRFDQRITIRISKKLLEQVTRASETLDETKSAFIKRSISSYIAYHQKVERPIIRQRQREED